ncbi:MAG: GNAT family N-acetyltransferase [Actinobacteria bacterium]|nr:GNAT family N-acetyltransferase [Actinomycetota bacterium]
MPTSLRPIRADDLPELVAVVNRRYQAAGIRINMQADELGEEIDSSLTNRGRDTRVAVDESGRIVGYTWTIHLPSDVSEERCYVEGGVDTDRRGLGIGHQLLTWSLAHARERLDTSSNSIPRYVRIDHHVDDEATRELVASFGFTPVRWFDDLVRPLTDLDDLPTADSIGGSPVTIEPWPLDDPLDDEIRIVKNTSFTDHWGSTPTSVEGWTEMTTGFGSRLDLSLIARDTASGRIVAFLLSKRYPADDELLGYSQAWVDKLGTLPEWRGRGLASALIGEALRQYAADGSTHAAIGVDADNPSGASRLYRALGFTTHTQIVTSQIDHSARLTS